jgi:8-oxo-dGTP pyrophosphatase MutT (NUDIX family)
MKVKTTTTRSAGGVVIRERAGRLYVLLIATHDSQRWTLPKGRLEAGEDLRTAALREVTEETGITARIIGRLDTVEYWFYATRHHRLHKFVDFFLMQYEAGQPLPRFSEVDGVGWYPISEAYQRAAYASTRKLLLLTYKWWQEREEEKKRREGARR